MVTRDEDASARALALSAQSTPPYPVTQEHCALHIGFVMRHSLIWLPDVSKNWHVPWPEHGKTAPSTALDSHTTEGTAHCRGGVVPHRLYKQSPSAVHASPTAPALAVADLHGALDPPEMPL